MNPAGIYPLLARDWKLCPSQVDELTRFEVAALLALSGMRGGK